MNNEKAELLEVLRDANIWVSECPVEGRSGDGIFDTFSNWYCEGLAIHEDVQEAYDAEAEADGADETDPAFWGRIAERCGVVLPPIPKRKVWVAYAVHEQDTDVLFTDGVGWLASGATKEAAEAAAKAKFLKDYETEEDGQQALEYVKIHSEEVEVE